MGAPEEERNNRSPQQVPGTQVYTEAEEISLLELVVTLWRYRGALVAAAVLCGTVGLGAAAVLRSLEQNDSVLAFRINFDGIAQDEYPNGRAFSTTDVIASPIVARVYERNDLARYLSQQEFETALSVQRFVPGLESLEQGYLDALDDRNLSPEERERLRDEYEAQRAALFATPRFSLSAGGATSVIPPNVRHKVLHDILCEWSLYVRQHHGLFGHKLPLVREQMPADPAVRLAGTDKLRLRLHRLRQAHEAVARVQGAQLITLPAGMPTITTLGWRLDDVRHFELAELLEMTVRSTISPADQLYVRSRLEELQLQLAERRSRTRILKRALMGEISETVAFGMNADDSDTRRSDQDKDAGRFSLSVGIKFLDRMIALANMGQYVHHKQTVTNALLEEDDALADNLREQHYYLSTRRRLSQDGSDALPMGRRPPKKVVAQHFQAVNAEIDRCAHHLNRLSRAALQLHLRPELTMYTVLEPAHFQESDGGISLKRALVVIVMLSFCSAGLTGFTCLLHDRLAREHATPRPASAA